MAIIDHDATVGALVHSILMERCADPDLDPSPWANLITRFVLRQRSAMPVHTRMAVMMLTVFFDFWPLWRFGKPFHCLGPPARQVIMADWRLARLTPCQDLLRFYEALTIFAWHTREEETHGDG